MTECRYCHQWAPAADDNFCSSCGRLLLLLEIEPQSHVLISTLAPSKEFDLRNGGARPMEIAIRRRRRGPEVVVFQPAATLQIPPRGSVRVRAEVDEKKLPAGFRRAIEYVCVVDGDERKQRVFTLDVRSGPMPKLLTPSLDFEDVEEGKVVERVLELTNDGSVTLRVKAVQASGSPHLRVEGTYADRLVKTGEKLSVPVIWQTSAHAPATTPGAEPGIRIELANHPSELFVPARARMFRYRLEATPAAVRFNKVLAKREHAATVRLENGGTTDVEVMAIESDQPWLAVLSRAPRFTLLCAESAAQKSSSPTTFGRVFEFKVLCHPHDLAPGRHEATITIRPHGQEPLVVPVEITIVEPKEYSDYIGIDFGTTNSVVAVLSQRGGVELVQDESSGKDLIPSVLVFDDPETYKIGAAARNEADTAPDRTVRSIKRVMGYERERTFFDRSYSAAHLASLIIRKLVQFAERKLQAESTNGAYFNVRKAIITVPANFHDLQIRDVLQACAAAGLDTEEERAQRTATKDGERLGEAVNAGIILDEPSAAVLYYIDYLRRTRSAAEMTHAIARPRGLKLLVFDYGGGTLDVAVASVTRVKSGGTGLRVLANMGDNTIGGDQIDVLLMNHLLRRCRDAAAKFGFDFDPSLVSGSFREFQRRSEAEGWSAAVWKELLRVRAQWKDHSEQAKIRIAERTQTAIDIGPDLIVRIAGGAIVKAPRNAAIEPLSEQVIDNLLQPVLARCDELIRSALALAEVEAGEIDYILHTGRQSLLPQIRVRVRSLFPTLGDDRDLLEEQHLKICVAKGAALYGSMRDRLVAPDARILLLSEGRRLPHSYGVEKFTNPIDPEFDEVIERGARYPIERTKPYPPEMIPPSGYLNLKFYQNTGSGKAIVGNPHVSLIGQISIDTAQDGKEGCDVTFLVGTNRTLSVFADGQAVTIEPARLHEEESWMG